MIPYYILLIIPALLYIFGRFINKKWNKQCIILFFIILLVILSLRGIECGRDLKMYSYFFDIMKGYSFEEVISYSKKGEIFFFILNKIVILLGGNFQLFLCVVALISIIPIALFYSKKSENALLTIALFLTVAPFPMFFSGLRQVIAMGLVVMAFKFIEEKKPIQYIISILIIMLFHISAIIALLFYPIYHSKISKNWLIIIIPLFVLVYLFKEQIFMFFLGFGNKIYQETYGTITSTGQYATLLLLIIFDIYCFIIPDKSKINQEYIGLRNLLLFSTLIQLFVPINMNIMRLNYYSLLFVPILIPKTVNIGSKSFRKVIQVSVVVMILFFSSYFIYNGYNGNNNLDIFPYSTYWSSK